MPDAAALAAFAGFVLAGLPRLLGYPGGLIVLAVVFFHRKDAKARRVDGGSSEGLAPDAGEGVSIAAAALAWVGLAVLPLPGAAPLPGAPDLLMPLGLLLGASLLRRGGSLDATGWARERAGRPLLVAAPLLAVAARGGLGLFLPSPAPLPVAALAAAVLAGVAYGAGLLACYAGPDADGSVAGWMEWLGWVGLGVVIGPGAWVPAADAGWAGPLLVGGLALGLAWAVRLPAVQRVGSQAAPVGWVALGLGLLTVLVS